MRTWPPATVRRPGPPSLRPERRSRRRTAFPASAARLAAAEERIGRGAARAVRRGGALIEELTDLELCLLRALPGPLSQREMGAELYLSLNTVKGYTKNLYRKLGAASRAEAVQRGRELGLI